MSKKGIVRFAKVLHTLQSTRGELIAMNNKQDLRLGQMMHEMKELVVSRFIKETMDIDDKKLLGG